MNILRQLSKQSDYHDNAGMIFNTDCMEFMSNIKQVGVFDATITDIPYDKVNRTDHGLRNLDKSYADILTFNLNDFLDGVYRLTKGTIIIFCGMNQVSDIFNYFDKYAKEHKTGSILVCLSGRGDKDIDYVYENYGCGEKFNLDKYNK